MYRSDMAFQNHFNLFLFFLLLVWTIEGWQKQSHLTSIYIFFFGFDQLKDNEYLY